MSEGSKKVFIPRRHLWSDFPKQFRKESLLMGKIFKNPSEGDKPALRTQIRWLIRRDMDEVLSIERGSFQFPWTEEEFLCCLRQRNCIGTVAEVDHKIVGFMIYELHKSMLRILNFAVCPEMRRNGIGTTMIQRLIDKLSQQRRREIVLEVRETNVAAQLFFAKNQFRAVTVLRKYYDDTWEDAYYMRYVLGGQDVISFVPEHYRAA